MTTLIARTKWLTNVTKQVIALFFNFFYGTLYMDEIVMEGGIIRRWGGFVFLEIIVDILSHIFFPDTTPNKINGPGHFLVSPPPPIPPFPSTVKTTLSEYLSPFTLHQLWMEILVIGKKKKNSFRFDWRHFSPLVQSLGIFWYYASPLFTSRGSTDQLSFNYVRQFLVLHCY